MTYGEAKRRVEGFIRAFRRDGGSFYLFQKLAKPVWDAVYAGERAEKGEGEAG